MRQFFFIFFFISISYPVAAAYDVATPSESQLKAACLHHFVKFIKWPDNVFNDRKSPLMVCILGNEFCQLLCEAAGYCFPRTAFCHGAADKSSAMHHHRNKKMLWTLERGNSPGLRIISHRLKSKPCQYRCVCFVFPV